MRLIESWVLYLLPGWLKGNSKELWCFGKNFIYIVNIQKKFLHSLFLMEFNIKTYVCQHTDFSFPSGKIERPYLKCFISSVWQVKLTFSLLKVENSSLKCLLLQKAEDILLHWCLQKGSWILRDSESGDRVEREQWRWGIHVLLVFQDYYACKFRDRDL